MNSRSPVLLLLFFVELLLFLSSEIERAGKADVVFTYVEKDVEFAATALAQPPSHNVIEPVAADIEARRRAPGSDVTRTCSGVFPRISEGAVAKIRGNSSLAAAESGLCLPTQRRVSLPRRRLASC